MRPPQAAARDAKAHRVYLQPAGLPAPHDGVCVFDPGAPCMSETLLPILTLLTLYPQVVSGTVCTGGGARPGAPPLPTTSNRAPGLRSLEDTPRHRPSLGLGRQAELPSARRGVSGRDSAPSRPSRHPANDESGPSAPLAPTTPSS